MFGWASENIKGVNFEFITAAETESNAESYSLKTRFENTKFIPGTRGFHSLRPLSRSKISAKRVSFDDEEQISEMFTGMTNVPTSNINEFNQGMFVAFTYD